MLQSKPDFVFLRLDLICFWCFVNFNVSFGAPARPVILASYGVSHSRAIPHNSAATRAVNFPPSASCENLDLPPVNLRFLQSHLTKNSFAIVPPHLRGIALAFVNSRVNSLNAFPAARIPSVRL